MTDIFDTNETNNPQETPTATPDNADPLAELVGEGKKYKTVEALVESRKAADSHIAQLESEQAQARETIEQLQRKVEESAKLKDVLDAVKPQKSTDGQPAAPNLDKDAIGEIVATQISAIEARRTTAENIKVANDAVVKANGGDLDKSREQVQARANELGVSTNFLMDIAAKSPTAFKEVMGVKETSPQPTSGSETLKGTVNTQALDIDATVRNNAYYERIRKENPSEYFKPHVQRQLLDDANAMGPDKFYGN